MRDRSGQSEIKAKKRQTHRSAGGRRCLDADLDLAVQIQNIQVRHREDIRCRQRPGGDPVLNHSGVGVRNRTAEGKRQQNYLIVFIQSLLHVGYSRLY